MSSMQPPTAAPSAPPCAALRADAGSARGGRSRRRSPGGRVAALALALACAAASLQVAAAKPLASMAIMKLNQIDPTAVCNDGSVGAFYMHTASDPAMANVWLVYLEGGDWCYDQTSCGERFRVSPQFMSSNGWPGEISLGGIMSANPAKSPWAGVNKAYLGYCSSDAWIGDVAASPATFGIAFRGQRIVSATLQFLVTNHGMGSVPGTRILFAGCSAGSRGALFTADYVLPMLESMGVSAANVEVQALFDSPLWVDVLPITGATGPIMPLETQTQMVLSLVGASNRLGPTCAATYTGTEAWKCLYGEYRLPFVTTPFVLNAAQFDRFQLPYNEGGNPPYTASGLAYAAQFQTAVRTALAPLPTAAQPGSDIYSSACFHHCVTDETTFWGLKIGNVSFRDLAGAWYFERKAPLRIVEACDGFKCGTCRTHRKHPGAPPDPVWRPGRPPRAPAAPDPFAIWSPPPGVLRPGMHAPPPLHTPRASAGGPNPLVIGFMLVIALGVGWACFAPKARTLRVMHGERSLELEVDSLIGGSARRPPGYGGAGSVTSDGGDAAAALASYRMERGLPARGGGGGAGTVGGRPPPRAAAPSSSGPAWTRK